MGTLDLNFGGVERPKYSVLPEDTYQLVLTDLKIKKGKTDPSKIIAHCVYEVVGHDDDDFNGKKVRHFQTLNDQENMWYAKVWAEALMGEPLDGEFSIDPDELVGKIVEAKVTVIPDNRDDTKEQNKIHYFILPWGADDEPGES